jgi:peptide/nickel transport system substrate-binding protein
MKLAFTGLRWAFGVAIVISVALVSLVPHVQAAPSQERHARTAQHHTAAKDIRCPKGHTKAQGSAVFSDVQFPDTLNPEQAGAVVDIENIDNLFDAPVAYNDKDKFFPDMLAVYPTAKNGGISKDGKTFTFHLKKGMVWSTGQPIVAADWKLGWAIEKDALSGPACLVNACEVTKVDTPNTTTVVFHLKHPDAAFLSNAHYPETWPTTFSNSVCGWKNNPHDAANCLFQNAAFNFQSTDYPFSGPYVAVNVVNNDRAEYTANPRYNILNCGAKIKDLRFSFYSDNNAMIAAAAARETDVTQDYTLQYRTALLSHKTYKTIIRPSYTIEHLEFNHDKTYNGNPNPIAKADVRIALTLAMNKAQILASALSVSEAVARQYIGSSLLVGTKTFKQPFFDSAITGQWDPLAKGGKGAYVTTGTAAAISDAKKLLTRAGYASGFTVDFQTTTRPATRLAEQAAICQNWTAINVKCNSMQTPSGKLFTTWDLGGTLAHGQFQVDLSALLGGPDPEGFRANIGSHFCDRCQTIHSAINANYSAIQDKVIDKALNNGDFTLSNRTRQQWYNVLQTEMVKQAHWAILYYRPVFATTDGHVKNVSITDNAQGPEWNSWAWSL